MNKILTLILLTAIFLISSCQNKMDKAYEQRKKNLEYSCKDVYEFGDKDTINYGAVPDSSMYFLNPTCAVREYRKLQVLPDSNGIRCLYDSTGKKKVQLRGMSAHGLQWGGMADVTENNIKALADDWNCNFFRMVIHVNEEGGYFCNPGRIHRLLDSTVTWCEKAGIYCLIDFNVSRPGNPNDSIYRKCLVDARFFAKDFGEYIGKPHDEKQIDLAKTFFTYCAKRYKDKKNIIYGLCAQPNGVDFNNVHWEEYDNPQVTWKNQIRPYCEEMIGLIRKHDPTVVIVCGTPHFSTRPQDVINNEPRDSTGKQYGNLMYALNVSADSYVARNPNFKNLFKDTVTAISPIWEKVPVFVTNFMTTDESGRLSFNRDASDKWLERINKYNISWCNWSFTSEEEGGLCCVLKWHCGKIPTEKEKNGGKYLDSILTESGKYIRGKLSEKSLKDTVLKEGEVILKYKKYISASDTVHTILPLIKKITLQQN